MTPTETYNEKELLSLVAAGDEAAFAKLFHQWQGFLSTHIFRITESRSITEEIIQDVFLKLWMTRESLNNIDNFKAWLLVVSRNHALNALRSLMRRMEQLHEFEQTFASGTKEEDDLEEKIRYTLIDEAIDHLPVRRKEIYLLHRHERLTYAEIADKLGIGKESVKTHLQLAVRSISEYVKKRTFLLILLLELKDKNIL